MLTISLTTGSQRRAHHWYLIRGLLRPWSGSKRARKEIDTLHRESRERKKCSRISGRASAAFRQYRERRGSAVRVLFPCVGCSKDLFGVGKALYLTHASIYLPLYKDLCRQGCSFALKCLESDFVTGPNVVGYLRKHTMEVIRKSSSLYRPSVLGTIRPIRKQTSGMLRRLVLTPVKPLVSRSEVEAAVYAM
jgi:hypothetical protein